MPNNNTTPEKILDIGGTEYLWGKIKDYQRDNRYIYSVKGTQTQSTNVWTGKIEINQLYNGLTIAYYLPYAGNSSNVTLNLTLGNNTTTGAIDVYLTGTTRLTNQYGAGSVILLTYWSSGSIKVAGTTTTNNRWLRADYDANTITTATTTGSGNAVTSISASNGALTVTKGSTFLTAHPTITTSTDTTSTGSPSHGGTFTAIDSVTRDTNGHVTKVNTKTITLPSDSNTDTKVNVTLGTTTKAYILGTSTTPTSTAKAVTSISDTGVYLDTTAGRLRATTYGITNGNYVNILSSSTLSANATQTFPSTGGTLLNTGTTSYTQTVTSSATNAYEIGKIKINGTETTIYGKYTDTNTDTKVQQSNAVANIDRPLLLSHDNTSVTDIVTDTVYRNSAIYANPSTGIITSTGYNAYNGDITIRKDTSIANDLPATLQFINYQSDNNITTNKSFIKVHDDYDAYASGANMLIQSGGNVIIGSGESPSTIYSSIVKSNYPTTEHLWLTTDIGIKIVVTDATDVTDVSKYKTFELSNSGNFYQTTSEAYDNDGFGIIGTKDRRFAEGNFHHIDVTTGVYYHKSYSSSSEDTFPLIYFNTSNIWIGATGATATQHKGNLNLSAGFDITNNVPFESAKVAVANSDNTSATAYDILHKGNTYHLLTSANDAWSSVGVPLTSGYIFKVLRIGNGSSAPTPPAWAGSKYDNGLVVGNVDGKMLITAGMDTPRVTFAGGHNSSTVTKPQWYFKLTGTNATTYNLNNFLTSHPSISTSNGTLEYIESLDSGDEFYAIDSLSRDTNGHVTGYTYNKYTIATDHVEFTRSLSSGTKIGTISINNVETDIYCNNNNNVTQTNTTQSIDFRILLSNTNTDTMQTDAVYKNSKLLYNPGTGTLSTPIISLSYTNSSNTSLNFNTKIKPIVSSFNSTNYQTIQISDGTSSNNIYITPSTNNTGTIGHTSLKWNGIYATTFYGGLNGTISSNTTATTQSTTDSSTKVATTKFVKDAITDSRVIHTAIGTAGSAGWVKIATMKHTSTYNNEPIMLTIVQRGDIDTYHLQISFKSVNSTDPELNTFKITTESAKAYLFKSATSTWDLYVKKLNTYESINVTGFSFSSFSSSHMTWTWTDTQVTDSSITSTSGTLYGGTHAVSYDVETVKLYTRVANNTTSSLKCVPFLQDSANNLDASGKLLYSSGFCFQFRTGQAAESPTNQQDGVDVLVLGNTTVSGTAGNSSGILQLYSKLSQGIQLRANKNSDSVLPSVALPAKANTSVLMSEIIMYEYSSGDKVSTYTSATYSTQEFAYFKVFVSLNASNSGYSCYDVIYNNTTTLNEFALAWGKNTSGTGTVTLSTIMIQVSKSNNKYTFTATTSNSFSVTGSTTSSVTSPTVYIRKIIGVICESYNVL